MSKINELLHHLKDNSWDKKMIAARLCTYPAAFFADIFVSLKIKPNTITIFMILFGVFGSIIFSLPNLFCKIAGYIMFYLWFTMDVSDGMVARYTKTFSTYGTEMDYMAHLICHPLMNLAIFFTYSSTGKYDVNVLAILFIVFISIELIIRNFVSFSNYLKTDKENDGVNRNANPSIFRYLSVQAILYPNFIFLFVPLVILDFMSVIDTLYILVAYIGYCTLIAIRGIIKYLLFFYKN